MNLSYNTFKIISTILDVVNVFFLIYLIVYSLFMLVSVISGSVVLFTKKRQRVFKNSIEQNYHIPISIIVPAYNEEVTVADTVTSLLNLNYSSYEIIVVDDGSKDNTAKVLIDAFELKKISRPIHKSVNCNPEKEIYETYSYKVPVILVRKENGGKADALNMGINVSNFPYFICIDADSQLQYDTLTHIVSPILEKDKVVAVGGAVRPSNDTIIENGKVTKYRLPKKALACMQTLEYDRTFLSSRLLFDSFNGSLIISGALGLFKKDVVIAVGGYDKSTMGEDMELVCKLHEFCVSNDIEYKICYASDAICWSQVPESLKDLCKQRRRWHIGLFQSLNMHSGLFMKANYGLVSIVSYLYYLIYELLSPFIEVFGIITIILSILLGIVNYKFMIGFFLLYAVYSSVITLTAFFTRTHTTDLTVSFSDALKAIALCLFEVSILRFIMAFVRFLAIIRYNKGKKSWGKIQRVKQNIKE